MAVTVHIHKTHRQYTDGLSALEAQGDTISACLEHLISRFPSMKAVLFDKKGKLKYTIEIYLNMESAYPDELTKKVKDGDDIHITLMIAGG